MLFAYQLKGAKWLTERKHALLADEMGLGKSAQAIHAADLIDAKPILVLCPAITRLNWQREFAKFSTRTLTISVLITGAHLNAPLNSDVTICSYDLAATKKGLAALSAKSWDVCFLDEAHYLKNRKAKRTRAVLGAIVPRCERVWMLSGTPAPNHPGELWPALRVLGATSVDYWSFVRRYCRIQETPFGVQIVGGQRIDELRKIFEPVVLRRKKEDVMLELPAITHSDVFVEPTPPRVDQLEVFFRSYCIAKKEYHDRWQAQEQLMFTNLANLDPESMVKVLASLGDQISSARQYIGLQKVPKVAEIIRNELDDKAYDKILLLAYHRCVIETLREELRLYRAVTCYGGTSAQAREKHIRDFRNDKYCQVFIGQIQSLIGINLEVAHHVGVVEAAWTPATNAQAIMRVHRIGQTKPVTVRWFSIANSIDERIHRVLRRKTKTFIEMFDEQRKTLDTSDAKSTSSTDKEIP